MQTHQVSYSSVPSPSTPSPETIRITGVVNENWRGKNDPVERRRIQNRLNQRAFRQRQRAGESPKLYKPRTASTPASQHSESEDGNDITSPGADSSSASSPEAGSPDSAGSTATQLWTVTDSYGRVWDELGQLINRNLMTAAATNAQRLGISLAALQSGIASTSPQIPRAALAALKPIELQHQIVHDPIIDTIPHARLRFNILRAIYNQQIDAAQLSRCIRGSGALENVNGNWQRGGLVVWSTPEQVGSWEISESFLRRWAFLLQGCEDLIAVTNTWRSKRGERLFPASVA
ncbi:hypothetical protein D0864_07451 [Hortaea werneckii]|uniref:BZIP domain-containing protein n=1 Tax=Hortaea werneckii TaxID=91943 RepID=A0A3M7F7Q5_HORWE|nr:hypothetical protein D0864_07451 [Hortaea werneckii]